MDAGALCLSWLGCEDPFERPEQAQGPRLSPHPPPVPTGREDVFCYSLIRLLKFIIGPDGCSIYTTDICLFHPSLPTTGQGLQSYPQCDSDVSRNHTDTLSSLFPHSPALSRSCWLVVGHRLDLWHRTHTRYPKFPSSYRTVSTVS